MSINKPVHVIIFAIVLGFFSFLASATWSAIFIVSLPMAEDAIIDAVEIETGEDRYGTIQTEWWPIEFKNSLEELKYYHNLQMLDRNRYWLYGQLILGGLLSLCAFYIIPKWRNTLDPEDSSRVVVTSVFLGVLTVLIMPFVFGRVLPAPVKWFPQEIIDIAELRENEVLNQLKVLADKLDEN